MRILPLFAATMLFAGTAQAGPLCRDTKGLFTPCTKAVNDAWQAQKLKREQEEKADAAEDAAPAAAETPATAGAVAAASGEGASGKAGAATAGGMKARHAKAAASTIRRRTHKPELFATGKLCRDSKGLFTPCPR